VKKHPDRPWNWCSHKFIDNILKPTQTEFIDFYRAYFAVRRIWRAWFRANTNPEYKLCCKRLTNEYKELSC
jgi:hypothetical protein